LAAAQAANVVGAMMFEDLAFATFRIATPLVFASLGGLLTY
jgi:ABC-type uncharacterized transport system permease subunit